MHLLVDKRTGPCAALRQDDADPVVLTADAAQSAVQHEIGTESDMPHVGRGQCFRCDCTYSATLKIRNGWIMTWPTDVGFLVVFRGPTVDLHPLGGWEDRMLASQSEVVQQLLVRLKLEEVMETAGYATATALASKKEDDRKIPDRAEKKKAKATRIFEDLLCNQLNEIASQLHL